MRAAERCRDTCGLTQLLDASVEGVSGEDDVIDAVRELGGDRLELQGPSSERLRRWGDSLAPTLSCSEPRRNGHPGAGPRARSEPTA